MDIGLSHIHFFAGHCKSICTNWCKNQLNISVAGIEYDDAGFTKLKEGIKNNKKVQDVKQSFSQNTAKLSLTYAGMQPPCGMSYLQT